MTPFIDFDVEPELFIFSISALAIWCAIIIIEDYLKKRRNRATGNE